MEVTVWTTESCVQCVMTKKKLAEYGIPFVEKSLTDHPLVVDTFKAQGFLSAPIVTTDIKTWSGFRLDKIKSLANHLFGENK